MSWTLNFCLSCSFYFMSEIFLSPSLYMSPSKIITNLSCVPQLPSPLSRCISKGEATEPRTLKPSSFCHSTSQKSKRERAKQKFGCSFLMMSPNSMEPYVPGTVDEVSWRGVTRQPGDSGHLILNVPGRLFIVPPFPLKISLVYKKNCRFSWFFNNSFVRQMLLLVPCYKRRN